MTTYPTGRKESQYNVLAIIDNRFLQTLLFIFPADPLDTGVVSGGKNY